MSRHGRPRHRRLVAGEDAGDGGAEDGGEVAGSHHSWGRAAWTGTSSGGDAPSSYARQRRKATGRRPAPVTGRPVGTSATGGRTRRARRAHGEARDAVYGAEARRAPTWQWRPCGVAHGRAPRRRPGGPRRALGGEQPRQACRARGRGPGCRGPQGLSSWSAAMAGSWEARTRRTASLAMVGMEGGWTSAARGGLGVLGNLGESRGATNVSSPRSAMAAMVSGKRKPEFLDDSTPGRVG